MAGKGRPLFRQCGGVLGNFSQGAAVGRQQSRVVSGERVTVLSQAAVLGRPDLR
jgi:hypothetical protein